MRPWAAATTFHHDDLGFEKETHRLGENDRCHEQKTVLPVLSHKLAANYAQLRGRVADGLVQCAETAHPQQNNAGGSENTMVCVCAGGLRLSGAGRRASDTRCCIPPRQLTRKNLRFFPHSNGS